MTAKQKIKATNTTANTTATAVTDSVIVVAGCTVVLSSSEFSPLLV
jgi:hypothetical protein